MMTQSLPNMRDQVSLFYFCVRLMNYSGFVNWFTCFRIQDVVFNELLAIAHPSFILSCRMNEYFCVLNKKKMFCSDS
jgi:hypothetical protein